LTGGGIPWQINVNGHLVDISGDNLHDVGISGDRFRTGNFGTSVVTPIVDKRKWYSFFAFVQ